MIESILSVLHTFDTSKHGKSIFQSLFFFLPIHLLITNLIQSHGGVKTCIYNIYIHQALYVSNYGIMHMVC